MNAAARMFNQGVMSRGWVVSFIYARIKASTIILVLAMLTTALSIVYVTDMTRGLHATYQQSLLERDHLHVQWDKLLLEKSTWMTQARVQQVAEDKLGMAFPDNKSVIVVNTEE
jgi:cell division protein FtsL